MGKLGDGGGRRVCGLCRSRGRGGGTAVLAVCLIVCVVWLVCVVCDGVCVVVCVCVLGCGAPAVPLC